MHQRITGFPSAGGLWANRLVKRAVCLGILVGLFQYSPAQNTVTPLRPLPSARQLSWEDLEFCLFVHFGPNTFTDLEWGKGNEKEEIFNPTQLDCGQWVRIAKAAGARGIIITAKHHDGFCLWPSAFSRHTVRESKWRNGRGDVLKELSDSCKAYGLLFGVYLSPWDRNHPEYGSPGYNDVYVSMMQEVVTRYGPLFEFWWDGANGEGPNGKKQVYDFGRFENSLRSLSPGTVVFSDIGPDIRWVGNEDGIAGRTNWDLLDTAGFSRGAGAPPGDTLNMGNVNGKNWIPAECDVSIRKGWFYHHEQDNTVKSPEQLFGLYMQSVGRGASLLLNVPPDRRGLISSADSSSLVAFRKLREDCFRHSLLKQKGVIVSTAGGPSEDSLLQDGDNRSYISLGENYRQNYLEIKFASPVGVNCLILQEPIQMGQRISQFTIRVFCKDGTVYQMKGSTVGHKRIVSFPRKETDHIRITIGESKATPLISELNAYLIPERLTEKE